MNNIIAISLCDAYFYGYSWDTENSRIEIKLSDIDKKVTGIICNWISEFYIQQKDPGPMLSWDGKIIREESGKYKIEIEFAHAGSLLIVCEELEMIENKNPTTAST